MFCKRGEVIWYLLLEIILTTCTNLCLWKKGKTHKFCTRSTDSLSKCNFLAGGPLCAGKEAILVIVLQTWTRKHRHPTENWKWLNNELFWNFFLYSVLEILNRGKGAWWILARSVFHRWLSFSIFWKLQMFHPNLFENYMIFWFDVEFDLGVDLAW